MQRCAGGNSMRAMSTASDRSQPRVGLRSIALPVEHGGWGFTLEPVLLGLLVAYSAAAWELSVAAVAVFLARRPFKLVLTDLRRRRWLRRTSLAAAFAAGYGVVAVLGLVGALVTAPSRFLMAYAVAAPFVAVALVADANSRSRDLVAELAGSIAMGSTAAAIALADGWPVADAFGLWLVLAGRAVATIALVRGQIRRVHAKTGPIGSYPRHPGSDGDDGGAGCGRRSRSLAGGAGDGGNLAARSDLAATSRGRGAGGRLDADGHGSCRGGTYCSWCSGGLVISSRTSAPDTRCAAHTPGTVSIG